MKSHYNFKNGVRGKFYRPNEPKIIKITLNDTNLESKFEIFHDEQGNFHFRLKTKNQIVFTSQEFKSKNDCFSAIEVLKEQSVLANTVEI